MTPLAHATGVPAPIARDAPIACATRAAVTWPGRSGVKVHEKTKSTSCGSTRASASAERAAIASASHDVTDSSATRRRLEPRKGSPASAAT